MMIKSHTIRPQGSPQDQHLLDGVLEQLTPDERRALISPAVRALARQLALQHHLEAVYGKKRKRVLKPPLDLTPPKTK